MNSFTRFFTLLVVGFLGASIHGAVLYVDINGLNPVAPYSNWSTASTNMQDAINASSGGDRILVTNGVYVAGDQTLFGAVMAINKSISVESINGPVSTSIDGGGTLRCAYLTNGALIVGFTLTNGYSDEGGGAYCTSVGATLSNCVVSGNSAYSGAGVSRGTLYNCIITNNSAPFPGTYGGGVYLSALSGCTIVGNSANVGGGVYSSTLTNCLIVGNSAVNLGGGLASSVVESCTIMSNTAATGAGSYFGTFFNCTIVSNSTPLGQGGGVHAGALSNCVITGNVANMGAGASGGSLTNCLIMNNRGGIGAGAYSAKLWNCTVLNNRAGTGGGAYNSTLNNCLVLSNAVTSTGGGAYGGTLFNSTFIGNTARDGGGSYAPNLMNNCTVVGNLATNSGGGVNGNGLVTMRNCIVFYNTASANPNYSNAKIGYCCTTPISGNDATSFTNPPTFSFDGGLRLGSNSPCINAGHNNYNTNSVDLDGNPRLIAGTVDIGAYEFQFPASKISYAWLTRFGLPLDGSADPADSDTDGHSNWQEWQADTTPTNSASVLRMLSPSSSLSGVTIRWQSVATRNYWLERATNQNGPSNFSTLATNLVGTTGTRAYTDTTAAGAGPYFYRVGVVP